MKYKISSLLFIFFCFTPLLKADWYPITKNFYRSTYKSGSQNWDILQAPGGWMYFANSYGLLEFDGQNWTTYPVSNNTCVRSLHFTRDTIFAGAENEFGYFEPTPTGHLEYHSLVKLLPPSDRYFGNVWKIHQISDVLYFQAENIIFKYSNGEIKKIPVNEKIEYSTVINDVLYVITENNVYYFVGEFLAEWIIPEMKGKRIVSILPGRKNEFIYVTAFDGLFVNDGQKVYRLETDVDDRLNSKQVFSAVNNDKFIAVGTVQDGLIVIDYNGKVRTSLNKQNGLSNNTILNLDFDRDGNLWLGLDQGIDYVLLNFPITNLYGFNNSYGKGTASATKNEKLYLGTNQGLFVTDRNVNVGLKPTILTGISGCDGQVWNLSLIDNTLFCSHNNGLFVIDDTKARRIYGINNAWTCKPFDGNTNELLVGTYDGFYVIKKNDRNEYAFSHKIKGYNKSVAIFEDDGKYLWVGSAERGIIRLSLNTRKDSVVQTRIYTEKNGLPDNLYNGVSKIDDKLIFGTQNGVFRYDEKADSMYYDPEMNNRLGNYGIPFSKFFRKGKTLWFISRLSLGYSIYNDKTKKYDINLKTGEYFKDIFFPGFEHVDPITDSLALVGSETGFSLFRIPDKNPDHNFSVCIRKFFSTGVQDSLIYGSSYRSLIHPVSLPYSGNSVRFEFSTSEYLPHADVKYSYMLNGYDESFSLYSQASLKEYTGLPEGKYTFIVKAISNYEDEPVVTEFSFEVQAPWYRTNTAYIIYFLLTLFCIYLVFNLLNHEISRQKKRVEKQKAEELKAQEEVFLKEKSDREKEMMRLQTKQLENELKIKSNELAGSVMNIVEKNEIFNLINNGLSKILSELKSDRDNSIAKQLKQLQSKINQNISQDDNWKKVEENFNLVHEDFFTKLMDIYPDISKTERKLCALLRMELSSKEIAQLTNISPRSVEIARYRIRKKMNLDRNDNLIEVLCKI